VWRREGGLGYWQPRVAALTRGSGAVAPARQPRVPELTLFSEGGGRERGAGGGADRRRDDAAAGEVPGGEGAGEGQPRVLSVVEVSRAGGSEVMQERTMIGEQDGEGGDVGGGGVS